MWLIAMDGLVMSSTIMECCITINTIMELNGKVKLIILIILVFLMYFCFFFN